MQHKQNKQTASVDSEGTRNRIPEGRPPGRDPGTPDGPDDASERGDGVAIGGGRNVEGDEPRRTQGETDRTPAGERTQPVDDPIGRDPQTWTHSDILGILRNNEPNYIGGSAQPLSCGFTRSAVSFSLTLRRLLKIRLKS